MDSEISYWHQLADLAIVWAKEMGKIHLSYFRGSHLDIELKGSINDVVTAADKTSEKYFIEQVSQHCPDHSILGEESGLHSGKSDYCWVVDPLDGTTNFSQGLPIFSVSIGLQYKGETILGIVYAPYLDELYTAIKGEGSLLNGKSIHVSTKKKLGPSVLTTGFPCDKDTNPDNNLTEVSRILPQVRGIRRYGSAAYDLCSVAAGFFDGYWEPNLHLWDVCAGILIVQEAGGKAQQYRHDRGISLLAANPDLFKQIEQNLIPSK